MASVEVARGDKPSIEGMDEKITTMQAVEPKMDDSDDNSFAEAFDQKATKRLLRKIDFFLIPFLALLYLLSFLDRTNIGNARLAGLEKSLGMEGLDYNNALAIFFPFYVAAEIPSNIMMKRTRPSIWIPSIMVAWGFLCCMMGIVKNYDGLLATRAILGMYLSTISGRASNTSWQSRGQSRKP